LGNPQKSDYEIVEKYATQTKICDILDKEFNSLSGGQKQWVAITRAIVQETPIMIMDEPMSALDFGKQGELLILLHELNTQGKTIILTTHNPNHCFCIPNAKVCLIHKGVIEAYGTAESVFTENIINKIFGQYVRKSEDGSLKFSLSS
jgi:ABC-type cobalamin/Fe3+-siderophores transport system ATPase subunit